MIKYFTSQCKSNPKTVIPLFKLALERSTFDNVKNGLLRSDELVGFIACAYTALKANDKESLLLKKDLLTTFDVILKDPKLKNRTNKFLEDLIN